MAFGLGYFIIAPALEKIRLTRLRKLGNGLAAMAATTAAKLDEYQRVVNDAAVRCAVLGAHTSS